VNKLLFTSDPELLVTLKGHFSTTVTSTEWQRLLRVYVLY